jgi:hypothetical protein
MKIFYIFTNLTISFQNAHVQLNVRQHVIVVSQTHRLLKASQKKDHNKITKMTSLVCIPQDKANAQIYQSFLMVTSVKKIVGRNGQSFVSCGNKNVAPWGSLYLVYSPKSKHIYKNIECAREDGNILGCLYRLKRHC